MTKKHFTVAIPTYNGETRLPDVLERLRLQINTAHFAWEIIVVDNNSTDKTHQVVQAYQTDWQCAFHLRYCFEPKQGAGYARKCAVKNASSELIGFLDDDNYPALDWVCDAYRFAQFHPNAGAYGSKIEPEFEIEAPPGFHEIAPFFAITQRGNEPKLYDPQSNLLPPSAGLVVRKKVWEDFVPDNLILTGRTSDNFVTGEDLEALMHLRSSGCEVWYNPDMRITHCIPAWRLQREYLLPFFRGIGLSRYVTRMVYIPDIAKPFLFLAYFMNDARRLLQHIARYKQNLKTDIVGACLFQFYIGSLISFFYLYSNGYLSKNKHD